MAALLGLCSFGTCAASCALSAICAIARSLCCGGSTAHHTAGTAKVLYVVLMFVTALFALGLYGWGDKISWFRDIPQINAVCTSGGSADNACYGPSAVLRISLALTVFFALNLLGVVSAATFAGWWSIKAIFWAALLAGSLFIPGAADTGYAQVARVCSLGFVLAMVVILVDFAYTVQDALLAKAEATQKELEKSYAVVGCCQNAWRWLYLLISLILVIGSYAGIVLLFSFSASRPEGVYCNENIAFLSVTLVAGTALLALAPLCASQGVLTASVVSFVAVRTCIFHVALFTLSLTLP